MKVVCVAGAPLRESAGGPSGYLYLLKKSYDNFFDRKGVTITFIAPDDDSKGGSGVSRNSRERQVFDVLYPFYYFYSRNRKFSQLVRKNKELFESADLIHCHSVFDMYFLRRHVGRGKRIILTTHTPEPPYNEIVYTLKSKYNKSMVFSLLFFKYISDKSISSCGDILYPSVGAETVYDQQYSNYRGLTDNAKRHYVYTCVDQKPKDEFVERVVSSRARFKVGFLGRFNHVKGFDLYLELARKYKNDDVDFFAAGFGPIEPDDSSGVVSLGKISNPRSFLNSIDLLVVPNRSTYFDIVVLEAIAQGTPLLLADNGGNSDLLKLSSSIHSYDDEDLLAVLNSIDALSDDYSVELNRLYEHFFDISIFANVMADKYRDIVQGG